jgi:superfamily II DNA or RNA helicase
MAAIPIKDLDRVITSKGYAIKKQSLSDEQIKDLRKTLTVAPKVLDKFQKSVLSFPIYYESSNRFYVPRQWGIKHYGNADADITTEGLSLPDTIIFRSQYQPHELQQEIITTFLKNANGLICVPCGYGKTFMALYIALQLKKRFIVVVDKEFLMNQWKAEIENFIDGARVGILQSNKVEIDADKYDITIVMIQTICRREFPDGFFDEYGFTIFDECHHLGAAYFSQALRKIQTRHMLGLSATPDREDGLTCVFEAFLGEPVYKNTQRAPDKDAVVKAVWFDVDDPEYKDIPTNWKGETVTAQLLNQVAQCKTRNEQIFHIICDYCKVRDRCILVLSDRISQLEWFEAALKSTEYCFGYYIGGMKQSKLDENAEKCQILLATYQMASEAFSVKKLNTVILATPRKNVQQSTGRIFRQRIEERTVAPHIIDIIDSHQCHIRRWYVRQRFYKECEYTIQHINKPKKSAVEEQGSLFMFT